MKRVWAVGSLLISGFLFSYGIKVDGRCKFQQASDILTEQEKIQMLNEADDFIDDIPEGQSDRQADAVLHALQGAGAELQATRVSISKWITNSDNVKIRNITPSDGVARGVNMQLYRSKSDNDEDLPLLIYLHGGGWTLGDINSGSAFCEAIAATGLAEVLAVAYSLAPENPFPQGLYDCIASVEYAFENAGTLGTSVDMISLGGEGAGGNLALATALYLSDSDKAKGSVKSLLLYNPIVDINNENSGSWKRYSRGYGFDRRLMDAFILAYNNEEKVSDSFGSAERDVLKSPSKATNEQLSKLPPMLMISSDRDILYDQGKQFAAKIVESGSRVDRIEFPGAVHSFIYEPGQNMAFKKAVSLTVSFLTQGD